MLDCQANLYSPFRDLERSLARRDAVLDRMEELGYITGTGQEAKEYEIVLNTPVQEEEEFAPYFVRYVRDQLIDMFGAQLVYSEEP